MMPEAHANTDERQPIRQDEPSAAPPPVAQSTPPPDTRETLREAPPSTVSPPPTPPGRLGASIQRMPLAGRWALGLGLALLSGFLNRIFPSDWNDINVVLTLALALAAGMVLTNWWAALALDAAAMAGSFGGIWVSVQVAPGDTILGLTGMTAVLSGFAFWAAFSVLPFLILFLAGVGLGKLQGLTLGKPHALSAGEATASRWIAALAPILVAGFLAFNYSGVIFVNLTTIAQGDLWRRVVSLLVALILSTTCLLAGWLLRAWWGIVVATVAYVGAALFASGGYGAGEFLGGWLMWPFALYIVLPALVMSVIGTAIGMNATRRGGHPSHYGQPATTA